MGFFKEMKQFHKNCLKFFCVLALIGTCFCAHIYSELLNYERTTQSGALDYTVSLLREGKYEKLYELSTYVQTQFNPKEQYIQYMKDTYEWMDLKSATFREMYYSDNFYTYYDMILNNETIGTLMVKKADNGVTDYSALIRIENRHIYVETEENVTIYVNGVEVSDDYRMQEQKNYSNFDGLNDLTIAPLATRYHVDNLIDEAIVTVEDENLTVVKDFLNDYYYIGKKMSSEEETEAQAILQKFATAYSKWTTEDGTFYDVRQLMSRNTELYSALVSFNNQYFSSHDSIEFKNWKYSDFALLGEDGMIGTVAFDYVVTAGEQEHIYHNAYQLSLINFSGKWLVTGMSINNEE